MASLRIFWPDKRPSPSLLRGTKGYLIGWHVRASTLCIATILESDSFGTLDDCLNCHGSLLADYIQSTHDSCGGSPLILGVCHPDDTPCPQELLYRNTATLWLTLRQISSLPVIDHIVAHGHPVQYPNIEWIVYAQPRPSTKHYYFLYGSHLFLDTTVSPVEADTYAKISRHMFPSMTELDQDKDMERILQQVIP